MQAAAHRDLPGAIAGSYGDVDVVAGIRARDDDPASRVGASNLRAASRDDVDDAEKGVRRRRAPMRGHGCISIALDGRTEG